MFDTQARQKDAQTLARTTKLDGKNRKFWATAPTVRRVMQGNKSRDAKREIAVRRAVHAMGMRYRVVARRLVIRNGCGLSGYRWGVKRKRALLDREAQA